MKNKIKFILFLKIHIQNWYKYSKCQNFKHENSILIKKTILEKFMLCTINLVYV